MVTPRNSPDLLAHLAPRDAERLRQACANLDSWPTSWRYEDADVAVGQQIVVAFVPFLLHLLDEGLAQRTVRRHQNNLWALGGELIRRRYQDSDLSRLDANSALQHLVDDEGGPLIYPRITESEQDAIDATCRKLHRFIHESQTPVPGLATAKSTHK